MAYLTKESILNSYKILSTIDVNKEQGLTQKVSALKYLCALDMFYKQFNKNCDLKVTTNRDLFAQNVGIIVKIDSKYCTKDFYLKIGENGRDYDCGSNFYSQSSVKESKSNTTGIIPYPKRSGWKPVMQIINQELQYNSKLIKDSIPYYLPEVNQKIAFVIWLLRTHEIESLKKETLRKILLQQHTDTLVSALLVDEISDDDFSSYLLSDKISELSTKDIIKIFKYGNKSELNKKQIIYYGAPGTGKSIMVDLITNNYPQEDVFRATFHPDTDYSTFVGTYKPKSHKQNMLNGNNLNVTQLLSRFFDSNSAQFKGQNKARYLYEALVNTCDIRNLGLDEKSISDNLTKQGFTGCAYVTEAKCMFNIYDWLKQDGYITESKISYEFIAQIFIKAYTHAWTDVSKPVFLIIEEINRGNCAQIFGDIFQLLDRDAIGYSKYKINPDEDIQQYLCEYFKDYGIDKSADDDIKSGVKMCLPPNLYIWATMNTSDQSLFPIDSAFKRRWDWEYVRIAEGRDKYTHQPLRYSFKVKDVDYDWWSFIQEINKRIGSITSSEDKKLGYFFCSAEDGMISTDKFVSKVCFYLWNDVFKDFGFGKKDQSAPFKKEDGKDITFDDFYTEHPSTFKTIVNEGLLESFITKLGVETVGARNLREAKESDTNQTDEPAQPAE